MQRVQTGTGGGKKKVMTTLLQINLHCSKAAQDLLHQVGIEEAADYILITEHHHIETSNWYSDCLNKSAIINANT